jgi:hypothetical protein
MRHAKNTHFTKLPSLTLYQTYCSRKLNVPSVTFNILKRILKLATKVTRNESTNAEPPSSNHTHNVNTSSSEDVDVNVMTGNRGEDVNK